MTHLKTDLNTNDRNNPAVSSRPRSPVENDSRMDSSASYAKTELVESLEHVIHRLSEPATYRKGIDMLPRHDTVLLPHTKLIGIPTMEGIDFLYAHEIIRCEGLQKCTRIVSTRGNSMVSAYNIGEFKKLLEEYGFFSCHKSHLINLMHVKKLTREGFVYLTDNGAVPLARRKRIEFLAMLKHL